MSANNDKSLEDKSVDELLEIFREEEQLFLPYSLRKDRRKRTFRTDEYEYSGNEEGADYLDREKARLLEWARNEIEQYKSRIRALEALIALIEGIDPNEESQYVIIDTEIWKEALKKKGIEAGPHVLIGWIKSGNLVTRFYARLVLENPVPLNERVKERLNEIEQSLRKRQLASGRRKDLAKVETIVEEGERVKEIRIDNIYSREDLHVAKSMLRDIADLLLLEAPDLWLRVWLSRKSPSPEEKPNQNQ